MNNNNNNLHQNYNNFFNNQISPTPQPQNTPSIPTNNNQSSYQQPIPQIQNSYSTNTYIPQNNPQPQNQIANDINSTIQTDNHPSSNNLVTTPLTDLNIDGTYNKITKEITNQEVNQPTKTKKKTITLTKENKVLIIIFIIMFIFIIIMPSIFDLIRKIKY